MGTETQINRQIGYKVRYRWTLDSLDRKIQQLRMVKHGDRNIDRQEGIQIVIFGQLRYIDRQIYRDGQTWGQKHRKIDRQDIKLDIDGQLRQKDIVAQNDICR